LTPGRPKRKPVRWLPSDKTGAVQKEFRGFAMNVDLDETTNLLTTFVSETNVEVAANGLGRPSCSRFGTSKV
jgi:hypothetical protein